jgi:hypothetical protein
LFQSVKRKILEAPLTIEPPKKVDKKPDQPKKHELPKNSEKTKKNDPLKKNKEQRVPRLTLKIPCPVNKTRSFKQTTSNEHNPMAVIPAVNVTIFMSCGTEGCRTVDVKQPE